MVFIGEKMYKDEDIVVIGEIVKNFYDGKLEDGEYKRHSKMKFGVKVDIEYAVRNGDIFITNIQ